VQATAWRAVSMGARYVAVLGNDLVPVREPDGSVDVDRKDAGCPAGANTDKRVGKLAPPCADLIFVGCRLIEATGAGDFFPIGVFVALGKRLLSAAGEYMPTAPGIVERVKHHRRIDGGHGDSIVHHQPRSDKLCQANRG
jgi:hypothetical protein